MANYTAVSLTPTARDALRRAALAMTSPVGRRVTISEVLLAWEAVAERHREEVLLEVERRHAGHDSSSG